jgi:hypothetical protein
VRLLWPDRRIQSADRVPGGPKDCTSLAHHLKPVNANILRPAIAVLCAPRAHFGAESRLKMVTSRMTLRLRSGARACVPRPGTASDFRSAVPNDASEMEAVEWRNAHREVGTKGNPRLPRLGLRPRRCRTWNEPGSHREQGGPRTPASRHLLGLGPGTHRGPTEIPEAQAAARRRRPALSDQGRDQCTVLQHVPESSIEILGHSVGGITYRHYAHRAPLAFKAIMALPHPTAFSALLKGYDGECPCCRRPFADAS